MVEQSLLNSLLDTRAAVRGLTDELIQLSANLKTMDPSRMTTQQVKAVFESSAECVFKTAAAQQLVADSLGEAYASLLDHLPEETAALGGL